MSGPSKRGPLWRLVRRWILILGSIYFGVTALLFLFQRQILYQPSAEYQSPFEAGAEGVVEVSLTNAQDQELLSWYGAAEKGQLTLLFFHGNAGNASQRGGKIRLLMAEGLGVFMLGYPGYGASEGAPSESSLLEAARLAYDHLLKQGLKAEEIVIYGASLGSAVAVGLGSEVPCRALILEAPMESVLARAQGLYPFLPIRWILKDQFLSSERIGDVRVPLFIVHGEQDRVIPEDGSQRLFERANEPKQRLLIPRAGHNNLYDYRVAEKVAAFLKGLPAVSPPG